MVRVFLAPKFNERGQQFGFNDQRLFFIEIDKFVASREFIFADHKFQQNK
jgi:hypothetical protein